MSHSIKVFHATPTKNLRSILRTGLDPDRSQGAQMLVWLHSSSKSPWAVLHTAKRHHVPAEEISLVTLKLPRSWLRRRQSGIWTCNQLIGPEHIISVNPWAYAA
jgi:hypothetical protein